MYSIALEICVPAITGFAGRKAYTQALLKDIRACAEELAGAKPDILLLRGLPRLTITGLDEVAICLKRSFDLSETKIIAQLIPERTSTAVLTTLRNLRVDWYTMDIGSLNCRDAKTLRGVNDLSVYDNLERLLKTMDMNCFTAVLYTDIPGETNASLQDSVNRTIELGAGAIELRGREDSERMSFGCSYLLSKGYVRTAAEDRSLWALPGFASAVEGYYAPAAEQYGMGCGAVTKLDGIQAKYTDDPELYTANIDHPDTIMTLV